MLAPPTASFQAQNDPIGPLDVPPRAPEAPSRPSGSGDRRHHRLPTRPHHARKAILFRQTWPDDLTHLSPASYYTYAPRRASSPSNLARYYPTAASAYYSLAPRTVAWDQPRHQRSRSLTMASNGHASSPPGSPARSASISLQAAATMNASLQREPSPRSSSSSLARQARTSVSASRRRSNVLLNLQLNDPSIPAPGEMVQDGAAPTHLSPSLRSRSSSTADPNHHRAPSLGELHQELEAEQEGQVNRLLQVIRQQQLELQRIQAGQGASAEDSSAISERSSQAIPSAQSGALSGLPPVGSFSRSPVFPHRGSMDLARRSRTPSRGASPRLRATSISQESGDWVLGVRDESAFYQAETQMLVRENQMLKHRIRELEKQLGDNPSLPATEPNVPSQLAQSSTATESEAATSK